MTEVYIQLKEYKGKFSAQSNTYKLYNIQSIEPSVKPQLSEATPLYSNKSYFSFIKSPSIRFVISGLQPRNKIDDLLNLLDKVIDKSNYFYKIDKDNSTFSSEIYNYILDKLNDGKYLKITAMAIPENVGKGYINYKIEIAFEG